MAVTTTYTCDRCEASAQDDVNFLNSIYFEIGGSGSMSMDSRYLTPKAGWCNKCVESVGLRRPFKPKEGVTPPTLGDQIEEIARTIVGQIIDERG